MFSIRMVFWYDEAYVTFRLCQYCPIWVIKVFLIRQSYIFFLILFINFELVLLVFNSIKY
jgi:hypothetical protein